MKEDSKNNSFCNFKDLIFFKIIDLDKEIFSDYVKEISLTTSNGEVTILADHINMAAIVLKCNVCATFLKNNTQSISINGGYMTIINNEALLFLS